MDQNAQKQWRGEYFGEQGAIKKPLFVLLSVVYSARASAKSTVEKFWSIVLLVVLFTAARCLYRVYQLSHGELDILASVARKMGMRRFAVVCVDQALRDPEVSFTSTMLLLSGLMRDEDAIHAGNSPQSRAHQIFVDIRSNLDKEEYDPKEQKIRVLRALCWFSYKHSPPDNKDEARMYFLRARAIAEKLGASDQLRKLEQEFPQLAHETSPPT